MYPKKNKGFPYRYEGFLGVGDRGENRRKKTESVFRSRFFFLPKNQQIKVGFRLENPIKKPTEKKRISVFGSQLACHSRVHEAILLVGTISY